MNRSSENSMFSKVDINIGQTRKPQAKKGGAAHSSTPASPESYHPQPREQLLVSTCREGSNVLNEAHRTFRFPTIATQSAQPLDSIHKVASKTKYPHHRMVILEEDPLDKYKTKIKARNWSEFANKVIKEHRRVLIPEPKADCTESVVFKSQKGMFIDATHVKKSLNSRRSSYASSKAITLEYDEGNSKSKGYSTVYADSELKGRRTNINKSIETQEPTLSKNMLGLDQLNLLESIGALLKCKSTYYPPSIEEVEYFVKTQFGTLNNAHLTFGQPFPSVEDKVTEDVKDLGLSAYRNNLHLSQREECVVLMDWLGKMKARYHDSTIAGSPETSYRNLQLLLSFCMGEAIRMSKVECNERAVLIQVLWEQSVKLTKVLEQRMIETKNRIEEEWRKKYEEITGRLTKEVVTLKEEARNYKASVEKLQDDNKRQERKIADLSLSLTEARDRCKALSAIVDHVLAKNITDLKKFNKKQKKMMLATIKKIQKDRKVFKTIFPGNGDSTFDQINKFENDLEKSMAGSDDNYEIRSDEILDVSKPAEESKQHGAKLKDSKKGTRKSTTKRMESKSAQTEKLGFTETAALTDFDFSPTPISDIRISPYMDSPRVADASPVSNSGFGSPLSGRFPESTPAGLRRKTEIGLPLIQLKEQIERIPVEEPSSKGDYITTQRRKDSLQPRKNSPLRAKMQAELKEEPEEEEEEISPRTGKIRVKRSPKRVIAEKREEEEEEKEEKAEVIPINAKKQPVKLRPGVIPSSSRVKPKEREKEMNTPKTTKEPSSTPRATNESPLKEKIDTYSKDLEKLISHFMDSVFSKDQITSIQQAAVQLISGVPLDTILRKATKFAFPTDRTPTKTNHPQKKPTKETPETTPKAENPIPKVEKVIVTKKEKSFTTPSEPVHLPLNQISPSTKLETSFNKDFEQENAAEVAMDDSKRELPKRLISIMNSMTDNITSLETDEYGEWLLDITKDDDLVRRILKNGHLLTLLLRNLYRKKDEKATDHEIRMHNMQTQTEVLYTAKLMERKFSEGLKEYDGKLWVDKKIQTEWITTDQKQRPATPMSLKANKVYVYNEKRQLQSTALTVVRPFNLGKYASGSHHTAVEHPSNTFLNTLVEKLVRNDRKYLNVCPTPVKLLIRTINLLYGEKMVASKDTISVRTQALAAFIYDFYINKYGLLNVAERKLKEMFISASLNRKKSLKIELFSRFIGLSDIARYTTDDLNFMFTIALRLLQNVSNATYVKREAAVFELLKEVPLDLALETVDELFIGKARTEIKEMVAKLGRTEVEVDWLQQVLVDKYRQIKTELQEQLGAETDFYTLKEFLNAIKKLQWNDPEGPDIFFGKWGVMVRKDNEMETVKKIPVEAVASHIFRLQMKFKKGI